MTLVYRLNQLCQFFHKIPCGSYIGIFQLNFIANTPSQQTRIILERFCQQADFFAHLVLIFIIVIAYRVFGHAYSLHYVHVVLRSQCQVFLYLLHITSPGSEGIGTTLGGNVQPICAAYAFNIGFFSVDIERITITHSYYLNAVLYRRRASKKEKREQTTNLIKYFFHSPKF